MSNYSAISWWEQVTFRWDDNDVHFVLSEHSLLDLYSAISLKNSAQVDHVTPVGHILLILNQPALTPQCCMLIGEQQAPILLSLIWPVQDSNQSASVNHVVTSVASTVSNCNTHKCSIARWQERSIRSFAMSIAKHLMWFTSLTAGRNT